MKLRSKLFIASVGSAGDAHPFIAIGHAMKARGHSVRMFSNRLHQKAIESAGLDYVDAGPSLDYAACVANPDLWHPIKGMGVLWRTLLAPSIAPLYRSLQAEQRSPQPMLVLAGPQMLGARLAQLHLGVALTTAYTAPSMLRTCIAPTTLAHSHWPRGTPRWLLQALWSAVDRYKLEPMARNTLARICQELDLPAADRGSIFGQWMHAQDSVALFPEWFAARKADYPAGLRYAGFAHYALDATALDPEIKHFLAQGSAPVVVTLGTGMAHAQAQFAVWQAALLRAGRRGIFLSIQPGQLPSAHSDHILQAAYAPFSALLPHCSAIVHHGGIGTCAQALAAGVPQIIQACAHDQFENARCIAALGVGQRLRRDATVSQAANAVLHWTQPGHALAAHRHTKTSAQAQSMDALCQSLERALP